MKLVAIQGKTKYTVDVPDDATFRQVKNAITVRKFARIHMCVCVCVCSTGSLRACASFPSSEISISSVPLGLIEAMRQIAA